MDSTTLALFKKLEQRIRDVDLRQGGPRGPKGRKGDTGSKGAVGPQGQKGTSGTQGPTGASGRNGLDGAIGRPGVKGERGSQGSTGPQGASGADGRNGVDGVDGVSVTDASIDFDGHLTLSLSDGTELDAGLIQMSSEGDITYVAGGGIPDSYKKGLEEVIKGLEDHLADFNNPHQVAHDQLIDPDNTTGLPWVDKHHPQQHLHDGSDGSGQIPHNNLIDRDAPDCHPTSAITGLDDKIQDLDDHIGNVNNPHSTSLENLTDTLVSEPKLGQGMYYDGTKWVNRAAFDEAWPTGLANGGELNIGPGANDIEVIAGAGVIVNSYTSPDNPPVNKAIVWPQINEAITAAPPVAGSVVWFSISDTGIAGTPISNVPTTLGELKQYAVGPDPTLAREEIFLGIAIHNGTTWNEVSSPKVINQAAETLREVLTTVLPKSRLIQGGEITEQANFELNQAQGTIWENNRNWHVSKSDPNREALPEAAPIQFQAIDRNFNEVFVGLESSVDPGIWDNNGTIEPVPGNNNTATIQRLYIDLANNYWILLGQQTYANWNEAQASRQAYTPTVPFLLQNALYLGAIIAEKGKNDWDPDEATFLPPTESGGGPAAGTPITTYTGLVDTPASFSTDKRKVATVDETELALVHDYRSLYVNNYAEGSPYYTQEWVSDSSWIAIANTTTTEPAFPQEVGELQTIYPDSPAFIETSQVAQVRSGYGVTFTQNGEIRRLQVWVPEIGTDITYALVIIRDPNGTTPSLTRVPLRNDQLTAAAWSTVAVGNQLYTTGAEVLVYLESLNRGNSNTVTGGWTYSGQSNTAPPAVQSWNHNNAKTIVRIDKLDLNNTGRQGELTGIVTGSTLLFAETANPQNTQTYVTLGPPTDSNLGSPTLGYLEYAVSLTNETGTLNTGVTTTFTGTVPVAQATKFVFEADKFLNYPAWANITSFLQYDDVDQPVDANIGYGINFDFQQLSKSDDWDLIPIGGGGGGGGGASSLDDLEDVTLVTPADGELLVYNANSQQWENNATLDGGTY